MDDGAAEQVIDVSFVEKVDHGVSVQQPAQQQEQQHPHNHEHVTIVDSTASADDAYLLYGRHCTRGSVPGTDRRTACTVPPTVPAGSRRQHDHDMAGSGQLAGHMTSCRQGKDISARVGATD